ncbi:AraC family transcriptional regulator [Clostridium swellfunianum]|uniref:AraC family transcriptional regulator n=1 Tax=Clostridium swellfunianum TaxID=1367462 RepID=UPI00202E6D7E|nr:AraC family transcriptional regulator [Clostridium swellfunianum]MCM0648004.1 AraC family transcriptional regulator [Clostridium swellfunianum]
MILEGLREKEIFTENNIFRIAVNTEANYNYPSHWHNALELIYVEKNNCTVSLNNEECKLNERDILIVAPGDIHGYHTYDGEGVVYFIQFDYNKILSFSNSHDYKSSQYFTQLITLYDSKEIHYELETQIIRILREHDNLKIASDIYINARFLDIAVILSRSFSSSNKHSNNINKTYELTKLHKAFEYIEENHNRQISLGDVARAAGFSEYHFSRVFKKATEKKFCNYLNEYRIKKAEKLIFDNVTITEAAYASGFNSLVTFNRIFKQVKGCSPSEYIKKRI